MEGRTFLELNSMNVFAEGTIPLYRPYVSTWIDEVETIEMIFDELIRNRFSTAGRNSV